MNRIAWIVVISLMGLQAHAQTAATGAVTGTITDSTGAVVPGATVTVTRNETGEARTIVSGSDGTFRVPLLDPGAYTVNVRKTGFKTAIDSKVQVVVTETNVVDMELQPGAVQQTVAVSANEELVQTESSAVGRVVDEQTVTNLPLVTRNYTQVLSLSPGVIAPVNNATDLGRGNGGLSGIVGSFGNDASIHSNGNRSIDNNFQMNGLQVNDISGSAAGSGGVPIPNPDTIQEFKVQTGQYDASYGRNAGANVDLITKSGTNSFHGNAFEFFRNTVLNANDFFANEAGAPRGVLDQNQFGGTLGGPILKDKLFFFGSYQGTRQRNGIALGCSSTQVLPTPLNGAEGTLGNDRSALAIAQLFNGQRGLFQNIDGGVGPAIDASAPTGNGTPNPYNINPVALALLQMKLPNGSFLIPSAASPSGLTVLRSPCSFNEDQYLGDVDWIHSERSTFFARYFIADSNQTVSFPNASYNNGFGATPGSPSLQPERFQALAIGNTYTLTPQLVNEVRVGFHRTVDAAEQVNPFSFSSIGATVSPFYNDLPSIYISGCCQIGGGAPLTSIQGSYDANDMLAWTLGKHNIRVGGGVTRSYLNERDFRSNGIVIYPTWPDFLLGLNAFQTGTIFTPGPPFGNVLVTIDFIGLSDRDERAWDGYGYFQDDIKLTRRFTLNVGLRYERIGELGDTRGRNGNFDPALANPNPPASGTLAGFTVPSNVVGAVPAGVTKTDNNLGIPGLGQNAWEPRVGFAWQPLPNSDRVVIRSGYGIYYTRPVGAAILETISSPPFGDLRVCQEACALAATAQNPFPPAPPLSSFPLFQPYSPSTNETVLELGQGFRPPRIQQYSFGVQTSLAKNYLLEVGYVGSHGTDLIRQLGLNQALSASPQNPVRGQTDNTIANIPLRLPYIGFASDASSLNEIQAAGFSWYNALEASLTKRFSNGLQFLASYTWSKELDTDAADPEWGSAGGTSSLGNQSPNPATRYGRGNFNRSQRFVASYLYQFPNPAGAGWKNRMLGGWSVAGVTTIQSGQYLTLTGTNANNVFGITEDRIEIAPGCAYSQLVTPRSVKSKLTNYFNGNCIDRQNLSLPLDVVNGTNLPVWPIIGADGIGTGFGDSGIGIVTGPGQANYDMTIQKLTSIRESMNPLFRAEFFNAFNHPQFSNPDVSTADSTFGQILSTSVNPRIIQFAVKLNF
ncbi:MAG: carboxypeptidase regulatory-like domain-containing protein [Acidobacteriaceae bacterium]|nr:carboxypeptidase regulatory-like domain-containing protein [Acidobacteriaceae bacterium]MBV9782068.1 carboxypeptidase regulatory-like domain-containing protein [Acidobacteriaceae bacterium]